MRNEKKKITVFKLLNNNIVLLSVIILLMVVQVAALFAVSQWQKRDAYENTVNRELDQSIQQLDGMFESIHSAIISLKLENETVQAMLKPELPPYEQNMLFKKLKKYKSLIWNIKNLFIYNVNEKVVYSSELNRQQ